MLQSKDTEWQIGIKKQNPSICCLPYTHLGAKDTSRLKVRGGKRDFMPTDKTGKQELQYSYQTKETLKSRPSRKTKKDTIEYLKDPFKKRILQSSIYMPLILEDPDTSSKYNRDKRRN